MFKTLLYQWQNAIRTRARNRRAYHALNTLDDRLLKDIGLCRYDLLAIKYGAHASQENKTDRQLPLGECSTTFQPLQVSGECHV